MSKKDPYGEKRKCCSCGKYGTKENPVTYGSDPFQSEINENNTQVWECKSCREESAMDI